MTMILHSMGIVCFVNKPEVLQNLNHPENFLLVII